jgi:hypothetical protein
MEEEVPTKICNKCSKIKSLIEFPKNKTGKDGHTNTCLDCNRKRGKVYRNDLKKRAEPEKSLEDQIKILCSDLSKMEDGDIRVSESKRLVDLIIEKNTQPTNIFHINTLGFGEKSSIAEAVTQSKLPLWLINNGFSILSPSEFNIKSDINHLTIKLPNDKKLTRMQISKLKSFLYS